MGRVVPIRRDHSGRGKPPVLVPESLAGYLFVFAASGAGFSLFAFDGFQARPGKA